MYLIKLDAIDSTNDFLKALAKNQDLKNYTVVTTKIQHKGKGQMGSNWDTESGKNITASVLLNNVVKEVNDLFSLNIIIAVSLFEVLKDLKTNNLYIKWPNDIMADNKKIAGILIENLLKENGDIKTIVGIGLNVNQTKFEHLPKATSLKTIFKQNFDLDLLLELIVCKIKNNIDLQLKKDTDYFWDIYNNNLYKLNKPTLFENTNGNQFMAIIKKVNRKGLLELIDENDVVKKYDIKAIKMLF